MKYIETFREGDRICDIYLCKVKQVAKTKAGKSYYSLVLQDKTGPSTTGKPKNGVTKSSRNPASSVPWTVP